jgi:hypothetical protein
VSSDRVTSAHQDDPLRRTDIRNDNCADETAIIDVPEVGVPPAGGAPLLPPRQPPPAQERGRGQYEAAREGPYMVSQESPYMAPPPEPEPRFEPRQRPPQQPSAAPPQSEPPQPEPQPPMQDWQPVGANGHWLPPGTPGSHWSGVDSPDTPAAAPSGRRRRARHSSPDEPLDSSDVAPEPSPPYSEPGRRARSRHAAEYPDSGIQSFAAMNEPPAAPPPQMAPPPLPEPAARHRGADAPSDGDSPSDGPPSGGQSVADLLARLQVQPSGGGRRRRREG